MTDPAPVVYILHGEDEYGMSQFVSAMQEKLGDPANAEMNITHLDGDSLDMNQLVNAASAMPFLAPRRIVVLENPVKKMKASEQKDAFTAFLDDLPQTTAMVLVAKSTLKETHWLLKWAKQAKGRSYVRKYSVLKGPQMANFVRKYSKDQGGEMTPQAAALLAEFVGEDPRMAAMEVDKLLAFVNYSRPIDEDDVNEAAAVSGSQADFFVLIDSLAAKNGKLGLKMLRGLLEEQHPLQLFASVVGHFRVLIQTRELVEAGRGEAEVAKELHIHPYRAKKLTAEARRLSLEGLEAIYNRLLDYDLEIKTGQIEAELALETLVVTLTTQTA